MQNIKDKSREKRKNTCFNRENGRVLSRNKVFLAQFFSKITAIIIILLTSCSSNIISETGSVNVYFCPKDNCESVFVNFVDENVLCTFYDLDSEKLINKLTEKKASVLVFYKNYDNFGKKVSSKGLMHDKFCIKNDFVITGSANPTNNGFNINYNNLLIINSKSIAENYKEEFYEIKNEKQKQTKNTLFNISGVVIENYFCPEDDCEEKVLSTLEKAESSIYFMTFSFTSDPIGELLIEKAKQIDVKGVMESFGLNKYSEYEKFDFPVKLERTKAMLHHKVFIIDNEIVITGSYNPTSAGNTKNDENIVIIHDKEIALEFTKEFERISNKIVKN